MGQCPWACCMPCILSLLGLADAWHLGPSIRECLVAREVGGGSLSHHPLLQRVPTTLSSQYHRWKPYDVALTVLIDRWLFDEEGMVTQSLRGRRGCG